MNTEFESYWKANLLFRLRGVGGLNNAQIDTLKQAFYDTWKLAEQEGYSEAAFENRPRNAFK